MYGNSQPEPDEYDDISGLWLLLFVAVAIAAFAFLKLLSG